jgi:hypothetical protein
METMLNVVFAGNLQIILVGEAELQLVLHPVNLPLKSVLAFLKPKGMWVYSNSPKGVEIAVLQMSSG